MHEIRSLQRGLRALELLNNQPHMNVAEMARAVDLPRTTAFRILENLCAAGYVERDEETNRYHLTSRVRNLSVGYEDSAWLTEIVRPLTAELGKLLVWPVSVLTPQYDHMLLRFTTDVGNPLAIDHYSEGTTVPVLTTASGQVCLAWSSERERALVLESLRAGEGEGSALNRLLDTVRTQGFAMNVRSPRSQEPGKTSTIAVPVLEGGRYRASLALRYIDRALGVNELKGRYLPVMQKFAIRMGEGLEARRTEQRRK